MRQWVRVVLSGASVWALMALLPYAMSSAHAQQEIHLNSSNVQVVKNTPANTDVLNLSLNVESDGSLGSCDGEEDDLLETGVHISVSRLSCIDYSISCIPFGCPAYDFDAQVNYVEHEIAGKDVYGTSYAPNKSGAVASKIVVLATPANTCGTWSINLQATGQNLSGINSFQVSLWLNDSLGDGGNDSGGGPACFDVDAHVGPGLVKPHRGVHKTRH
jgi:hypothetical protein